MAPIIRRLMESDWAKPYVIAVGQHTHLLDLAIKDFDIDIDERMEIGRSRSSIAELLARVVDSLDERLESIDPACIIAQGDTTTVLAAGLVAFHRRIFFVHVEAGLRTGNMDAPFPEEFNRRVVTLATSLHCAPTAGAMAALVAEGIPAADCLVTGNTVIDALLETAARKPELPKGFPATARTILLTAHRRENFGRPLENAFSTLRAVVDRYPDVGIFFPIHPNPNTKSVAERFLGEHPRIVLSEPLGYSPLVAAMQASWLIVTDSGGLQEEAPALGKPVLVIRETTERPEALDTGTVRLVGTDPDRIMQAISELHDDPQAYRSIARPVFPYGDGHAAKRVVDALRRRLMPGDQTASMRGRSGPVRSDPSNQRTDKPHKYAVQPRQSTSRLYACAAIAAVLFPACAFAQTVTFESTLQDHGFKEGIVLQGRAASSVFLALPRGARVTNARLIIDGQSTTPTLQRGSFSTTVNGQPVDAVSLNGKSGLVPLQRSIEVRGDRLSGFDALSIRFEADLRATTDPCTDDVDPANSVTISPQTRIAFDVNLDEVRSIADAIALLPQRPLVQLPAQPSVSAEIAAAALQLGVLLTARGQEPRFASARGDDIVAIRLDAGHNRSPGSPTIRIERKDNKLDILVDPNSDFIALGLLLQAAPDALVGEQAAISRTQTRSQPAVDDFQAFSSPPPAQRIRRFGEWRLNFPLVAGNGRLADSALLKLFIAPDWSNERPIATTYLNEQIVAVARADLGESSMSVPLPASLLRLTNTLRVTLERAGGEHYCAATDRGQAAQILPGSGLVLGDGNGEGFAHIAHAFGRGGQVVLPQSAADSSSIGSYLQLASRLLASLGPRVGAISVEFGTPAASGPGGMLRFETVGPGGLILPIADQIEGRDLRYEVNSPLAGLSAEDDGRTLLVQLTDVRNLPQPGSLYLGDGSKALIANNGVVWQNSAPGVGPSVVDRIRKFGADIFSKEGLAIALAAIGLLGLLLGSRAIVKTIFHRNRHKAG